MAIKNGTSSHEPTPPTSESPYRDSEDAGPAPASAAPPPYRNYGTTLPTSNANQSPFDSPEAEANYWARYHRDMKLSRKRKIIHLLIAFTLLFGLFYFLGSLAAKKHDDVDYAVSSSGSFLPSLPSRSH